MTRKILCYHAGHMTAAYAHAGLRFLYPENWVLDNRDDEGSPWSVSVHSPNGAFWALTVYDSSHSLDQLRKEMLAALEQDYSDSFFESNVLELEVAGQRAEGYDITFFYLDFLIHAKLLTLQLGRHACVVLYQGEQKDFETLGTVFEAITYSLVSPDCDE